MNRPESQRRKSPLSEIGEDDLAPEAIERIAERIAHQGPVVMRQARRQRIALSAGGAGLVLVAALWFWSGQPERVRSSQGPLPVIAGVRPCDSWVGPQLDVAARADIVTSPGTALETEHLEACRLLLRLSWGRVVVHAKDLGGGELIVASPSGRARVIGTVFSVEQGERFVVAVAEGKVEVESGAEEAIVAAGQRVLSVNGRLEVSPIGDGDKQALVAEARGERSPAGGSRSEGEPVPAPKTPPVPAPHHVQRKARPGASAPSEPPLAAGEESAEDLTRLAAQAKRSGDLPRARRLLARAGAKRGETAESAWISLARLELSEGHLKAALEALEEHRRRFPQGSFGVEAAWLHVETLDRSGDLAGARLRAEEIVRRWPSSPYAKPAREWLDKR